MLDLSTGLMYSRNRNRVLGLEHIEKEFQHVGVSSSMRFLDGELYKQGMGFQTITSIARR